VSVLRIKVESSVLVCYTGGDVCAELPEAPKHHSPGGGALHQQRVLPHHGAFI